MAAGHLAWDSVGLADLVPLVASLHGDDGELRQGDGRMEGSGYLLAAFNTQTNASTGVSDGNKRLEPGPLARWPAGVCFCTGRIFKTSSPREAPRKTSMIHIPWWAGRRDRSPPGT